MKTANIFHETFKDIPYWWEDSAPVALNLAEVPTEARVAIIGAGYAGLSTALELSKLGIEAVVFDAEEPGYGASTRSGGMVGGSASLKNPMIGSPPGPERIAAMMSDAGDAFDLLERLIREEKIDCDWSRTGRFIGAWSKKHLSKMKQQAQRMNEHAGAGAHVVSRDEQHKEIGSEFYFGGLVTQAAGHLQPALYYKGLLDACRRHKITICAKAPVTNLSQQNTGWRLVTGRGETSAREVVIATNGYTGGITPQFERRVVPIQPYIIATEPLDKDLAQGLSPKNRSFSDTRRIVSFYRLSSDKRRMLFGSRVKWRNLTPKQMAPALYDRMLLRYPQLEGCKITHAWNGNVAMTFDEQHHMGKMDGLHYAMGCNGTGIAMMTYLGTQLARKIAGTVNKPCAFESEFPDHPLYNGKSQWFLPMVGNYFRFRDWWDRKTG
jgi:glycine/D-amino acid oxidase-like deaminating enzyme